MLVEKFERRPQNSRLFSFRKNDALVPFFGAGANVTNESHFLLCRSYLLHYSTTP